MALSNIQPTQPRPLQTQSRENAEKTAKTALDGEMRAEDTANASITESIDLGQSILKSDANRVLVESVLARIAPDVVSTGAQELFQTAGKAEFEATAYGPDVDTSPEATAGRIVDGITGYIYGAWMTQNPDATEEDLAAFQEQVMSGFEKGLEDAKDILTGLQAMTPELEGEIGQTESLVRDQLAEFFEDALQQIREAQGGGETQEAGTSEV